MLARPGACEVAALIRRFPAMVIDEAHQTSPCKPSTSEPQGELTLKTPGRKRFCRVIPFSYLLCSIGMVAGAETGQEQLAEQARRNWPAKVRQAFGFEDARLWRGGIAVTSPRKSGTGALKWAKHAKNPSLECRTGPYDLSAFNVMSFWLHSSQASEATFMVILPSTRKAGGPVLPGLESEPLSGHCGNDARDRHRLRLVLQ